jgi:hypothetical protein
MPVAYIPDIKRRRIRVTPADPVTLIEMVASVDRQCAEGMWTFGVVLDLRVIRKPPSIANAQAFAAHVRAIAERHGPRGPVAMVARDPVMFAGAKVYKHFSARPDPHLEVFWSADDAEAWLDGLDQKHRETSES